MKAIDGFCTSDFCSQYIEGTFFGRLAEHQNELILLASQEKVGPPARNLDSPLQCLIGCYRKDSRYSEFGGQSAVEFGKKHRLGKMRMFRVFGFRDPSIAFCEVRVEPSTGNGCMGLSLNSKTTNLSDQLVFDRQQLKNGFQFFLHPFEKNLRDNTIPHSLRVSFYQNVHTLAYMCSWSILTAGHKHETGDKQRAYYQRTNEIMTLDPEKKVFVAKTK